MLYAFSEGCKPVSLTEIDENRLTAGVISLAEFRETFAVRFGFASAAIEEAERPDTRFRSTIDVTDGHLFCVVSLRDVANVYGARDRVGLIVRKNLLLLVSIKDDDESIPLAFEEAARRVNPKSASIERLICMFFELLLADDGSDLESYDNQIAMMEGQIETGETGKHFNGEILSLRRRLLIIRNYYEQLLDIFDAMVENEADLFSEHRLHYFRAMRDKITRLSANAQLLRDSLVQVREAYMAALDYNANRIMKVFTVVTTIFMPLTLLVGWYGMNFKFMPELTSRFGYPAVIVLSVVIVIVSFIFFKRKKLL